MKLVQGKQVAIKHIWYNRYVALYYNKIELNLTHTLCGQLRLGYWLSEVSLSTK